MEEKNIALLIDIENVSPNSIKNIIDDLSQKGTICIKRVYCVTDKLSEEGVRNVVKENNLEIKTQYNVVSGKSASDFNLVIDAMEILYTKNINCFAIVSSDSDFNILVNKIKSENKIAIGYGEKKTNPNYRNSYNEFIFVENLSPELSKDKQELIKESKVITIDKLEKEIGAMISKTENECMQISQISEKLSAKYPDFDVRTYDYKKFSEFIKSMKSIELYTMNDGHTYMARLNTKNGESKTKTAKNGEPSSKKLKEVIVKVLKDHNGRVSLAQIINFMKKEDPTFTVKKYGETSFKKLVLKYNWPNIKLDNKDNPNFVVLK